MNDEKFELTISDLAGSGTYYADIADELRARDTAQREALAQLQAEMPDLRANMTKALDLLQVLTSTKYTHRAFVKAVDEADEMLAQLRGKVMLKGMAEQQEARPAGTSEVTAEDPRTASQSAMSADDEHEAFSAWAHEKGFCLDCAFFEEGNNFENSDTRLAYEIWMARAALATQPAAGEPIHQWADQDLWMDGDEADMASARAEGFKTRTLWTAPPAAAHGDEPKIGTPQVVTTDCRTQEGVTVGIVDAIITLARLIKAREQTEQVRSALDDLRQDEDVVRLVTQPAAAHGDEAVRKDAERYRWLRELASGQDIRYPLTGSPREIDETIDAAMRAQGDGEVQ